MRRLFTAAALGLALTGLTGTAFADALDDLGKSIEAKWDKAASMSYASDTTMKMSNPQMEMNSVTTGSYEMVRKDAAWNTRSENKTDATQKINGTETKTVSTTLMIVNGDTMYTLSDTGGVKTAMKNKTQPGQAASGKDFFKQLREKHDCKILPDETINGQACIVVEATPKGPANDYTMVTKYAFSKADSMLVQGSGKNASGKMTMVMNIKNIKIDPTIAADRFEFKAPEGVTVMDMTKAAEAPKAEAAPTPAAETKTEAKAEPAPAAKTEEKKPEPKKEEKKKLKLPGM